ncbi:MAG: HEAT repeat domain-containing protein [Sandaracinus sp.]|nr:HEAT repeat domain-containing protein [Sandaracinus sp.]
MRRRIALLLALAFGIPAHAQPWSHHVPALAAADALQRGDTHERLTAARELGVRGDAPLARSTLVEALRVERDESVRAEIARSLGRRAHPSLADTLGRGLADATPTSAPAFADALVAVGTTAALGHLVDALANDPNRPAVFHALESAGLAAAPLLLARLRETPSFVPAIDALALLGDADATPLLTRILLGEHPLPARLAAARAIGRSRDVRAAPSLRAFLDGVPDTAPLRGVRDAVLHALATLGDPTDASRLRARFESAEEARRVWLEALVRVDPVGSESLLRDEVTSDDPRRVREASDVVLSHPHVAFVPILHGLLREGARSDEAATVLSGLGDVGVAVLLREADRPEARRELAWGVRVGGLSPELRRRAMARLRRETDRTGLGWRAIAGDADARAALEEALDPLADPFVVQSLGVLDPGALEDRLAALEGDAWVAAALALARAEIAVPPERFLVAFDDPERAPVAALLAAHGELTGRAARRRDRALRELLHASDPRARANAAWALGRRQDRRAQRALEDLRADTDADVRRAVDHALAELDPDAVAVASFGHAGLRFRVASGDPDGRRVEIALADGRILPWWTAPSGEAVLPDLPSQVADVRIRE